MWTSEPSGDWPADLGGEGGDKTQGVVLAVQQGSGMIGYADISGVPVDMKMARYSRDGGDYVTASAEAAAAVVSAARKADGRVACVRVGVFAGVGYFGGAAGFGL